jgi:hypothetical protein
MNYRLAYRISFGLTFVLTLLAYGFFLSWLGHFIKGWGNLSLGSTLPWSCLGLLALTGINCILRKRLIALRGLDLFLRR